jgi:predicted MFS family arabinose efflux permease
MVVPPINGCPQIACLLAAISLPGIPYHSGCPSLGRVPNSPMDRTAASLRPVVRPLLTIFMAQALMTSAPYAISVLAPDAASDLGLSPDSVGFLASTVYLLAMISGLGSEVAIARWGPTRTFQALLALTALGTLSLMAAHPLLAFLGAALIGVATGPMNPAGSFVLSRVTTAKWQPFVFSLKQCATPVGGMAAGAVLPILALLYDWRLALALVPLFALPLMVFAPRGGLEVEAMSRSPGPSRAIHLAVLASLRDAVATPALRSVVLMGVVLGACQLGVAVYFVVYLWSEAQMSPIEAGQVFVMFHVAGVVARIALGALAERHIATRHLLQALGVLMAFATATAATIDSSTALWLIYAITVALGASGNAWVGLFFAELARLAPRNIASTTGGAQFAMYTGIVVGPLLYGVMLRSGLSHGECFAVFSILALTTAFMPLLGYLQFRGSGLSS